MPLYPLPPLVFALASCLILVLAYLERPVESSIALGTVGLGIPVFFLFRRRRRQATGVSRAPATES